jgi:hypothetical protein
MSILRNARHESFALALSAGKNAGQSYKDAGFAPSYANASRLQRQDHIRQRIDEILDQKQRATDKALESAAARAGVDQFWVVRNLRTNVVMAMRSGDRGAANRGLEIMARHLGMLVDRTAITVTMHDDSASYLAKLDALVRDAGVGPLIDAEVVEEG